jgi:hypothetical protein
VTLRLRILATSRAPLQVCVAFEYLVLPRVAPRAGALSPLV